VGSSSCSLSPSSLACERLLDFPSLFLQEVVAPPPPFFLKAAREGGTGFPPPSCPPGRDALGLVASFVITPTLLEHAREWLIVPPFPPSPPEIQEIRDTRRLFRTLPRFSSTKQGLRGAPFFFFFFSVQERDEGREVLPPP